MSNERIDQIIEELGQDYRQCLYYNLSGWLEKYPKASHIERIFIITQLHYYLVYKSFEDITAVYNGVIKGDSGKKYYVDFQFKTRTLANLALLVELDGHDFHEKTKEQVRKDKERERDLIKNGYTILRYTGSEVYANPQKVVLECMGEYKKRVEAING